MDCDIKSHGTRQAWCKANGVSSTLTNLNIELYVKYICKTETLGQDETLRKTSFKTCAGRLGALRDLRLQQLAQGLYTSQTVTNPWSLETVSSFMAAKYRAEKASLCQNALNSFLHKQMSHQQLCRAMELALNNSSREWVSLIHFALTWMSASARRAADVRSLVYSALCTYEIRQSTANDPWVSLLQLCTCFCKQGVFLDLTCIVQVGVGPHPSKALAFVAGEGKSLPSGMCEASASVRRVHFFALHVD